MNCAYPWSHGPDADADRVRTRHQWFSVAHDLEVGARHAHLDDDRLRDREPLRVGHLVAAADVMKDQGGQGNVMRRCATQLDEDVERRAGREHHVRRTPTAITVTKPVFGTGCVVVVAIGTSHVSLVRPPASVGSCDGAKSPRHRKVSRDQRGPDMRARARSGLMGRCPAPWSRCRPRVCHVSP